MKIALWAHKQWIQNKLFPLGPTGSAKNAVNLAIVYHKDFNSTYPRVSPDIYHYRTENLIKEKNIKNEKQLMEILINRSLKFLKENPFDVIEGIFKKVYVITLSPFKDTRQRIDDINPITECNLNF